MLPTGASRTRKAGSVQALYNRGHSESTREPLENLYNHARLGRFDDDTLTQQHLEGEGPAASSSQECLDPRALQTRAGDGGVRIDVRLEEVPLVGGRVPTCSRQLVVNGRGTLQVGGEPGVTCNTHRWHLRPSAQETEDLVRIPPAAAPQPAARAGSARAARARQHDQ